MEQNADLVLAANAAAVTIARSQERGEAEIWSRALADHGIASRLERAQRRLLPSLFAPLFGRDFELKVPPEQAEAALAFLKSSRYISA